MGMPVIPESHADLLTKATFWHIATMGPDDEIQSSPVWGGWDGEHFLFSLTRGRQKYENLVRNPTIALSGIDPDNSYRYLEIRGTVVRIDDDSSNAFIDSMAKKYMDADAYPFHQEGDKRVVIVVQPSHTSQMG
jgi:PPOX class probable F420-dependent enzyme